MNQTPGISENAEARCRSATRRLASARANRHISALSEKPPLSDPSPPLQAVIVPVTALQQNCTLRWCTKTMRGAFTELDKLKFVAKQHALTIEKLLISHHTIQEHYTY